MLRYIPLILASSFLFSCAQPTPPQPDANINWLEDPQTNALTSEEAALNQKLIQEYNERKAVLAQVKKEDKAEKEVLEAQRDELEKEQEELAKLLEEKGLSEEMKAQIANAQTEEELREILKDSNLTQEEIEQIVASKKSIIEKDKNLRIDALAKIYARLIRNRNLGIEDVFCSKSEAIDQFVLSPVYYDTNKYSITKDPSDQLYKEVNLIAEALPQYGDILLQINGSTDERGTNVYNKSLGDFRWTSGSDLMEILGFEKEIRGISWGEECPLDREGSQSDEEWWGKNRRADFVWKLEETKST